MCGILGYLTNEKVGNEFKSNFKKSLAFLKYRGPDCSNRQYLSFEKNFIAFGHTRLSIIDLNTNSNQPFKSYSGKTLISFNGEVYNYKEIKSELIANGVEFKTNSDTEVIVNAYEYWGIETMLHKIDGMFAFGIFDFSKNILIIARDRFGKKPLYYHHSPNHFVFSSDIRSVKNLLPQSPTLNTYAFGYYLAELSTPEEQSIWNEIHKLKPGNYATIRLNNNYSFVSKSFWNLNFSSDCKLTFDEIAENTNSLLNTAIKKRLVADVRVSALLSGGLDSSLVVAKMAENSPQKINTYSVINSSQEFDESKYSDLVARQFGTNHTRLEINSTSLDGIKDLIYEYGEPFADSSMIPSYLISKEVSRTEKVVLGGDGGDEFFGGYDSYYKAYKLNSIKKIKWLGAGADFIKNTFPGYRTNLLAELISKANNPKHELLNRGFSFNEFEINQLTNDPIACQAQKNEHKRIVEDLSLINVPELTLVMNSSLHTRLLNDYLVKVDRASMYASLEMRSPFLDKDLALFASTLTPKQIYKSGEPKAILKAIAAKYFDHDFIYRKKMGFSIPIGDWFKNEMNKELREKLLTPNPLIKLNLNFIERLIIEHESGKANHVNKLWALFVFNIWAQKQK
ncbi:asparagine synthase (glutamine-hydrolyzing) [Marivirga sp. S37H4]|uniref:asparagine synthase (glutamine-hydrolyzing) n=1 Tax=Marivirga aurantiaca TaxID=2802615 RepID=A0A935CAY1_9BACT|nr:asparagine synthase (glutamine-hydrolyzing) [Marivirga aurantiaca]MBK6267011.1 asparagine synthase (glutamine-hydrolyzing) [Marivirga aurantiaca]